MDSECAQYQLRREHAAGAETLGRIEQEYRQILEEREKACRYPGPRDRRVLREAMIQVGLAAR